VGRFFPLAEAISARRDISLAAKCVHGVLSAFSRMEGGAFPSQRSIGDALGITARHVRNAVAELEALGLLRRKRRGYHSTHAYELIGNDQTERNGSSALERNISSARGHDCSALDRNSSSSVSGTVLPPNRGLIDLPNRGGGDEALNHNPAERREWLRLTLENFNPQLAPPDPAIVRRIDEATGGATEADVEAVLLRLFEQGLPDRMRSWGLLLKAVPEALREAA